MAKVLFVVDNRIQDPLGVMQLSSILKNDGHQVALVGYKNDDAYKKVDSFKPDVIGYSLMTRTASLFEFNRHLKKNFKFLSLWGGSYPTFFPEIINEEGVDAVVRGEAEISIKKVIQKMAPGIYELEQLVENLDDLPLPDRFLNDLTSLNPRISNFRNVIFNRGCPYHCAFCFASSKREIYKNKGKHIRFISPDRAIEELKLIEKVVPPEYRKHIQVRDSVLILNEKWTIDFLSKLKGQVNTALNINARANLINERIAEAIAGTNITVKFGVESGDDDLNLNIIKKGITSRDVIRATEILRKFNINYVFDNVIAIPGEMSEQALKTLELTVRCKPRFSVAFTFMPYPRTALAKYCYEKGFINTPFPDIPEDYHSLSILNFSEEEKRRFKRLHDLFSIIAYFRFLYPLSKFFIRLPLDEIYQRMNYAFSQTFKRYLISSRKSSFFFETRLTFKFIFYSLRNIASLYIKQLLHFLRIRINNNDKSRDKQLHDVGDNS